MPTGPLSYWWKAISTAFRKAVAEAKAHPAIVGVALIVAIAASIGWAFLQGTDEGRKKIEWEALKLLAIFLVALPLWFFWFLFRTPFDLHKEVQDASDKNAADLAKEVTKVAELKSELEALKIGQAAAIEKARSNNPAINIKRSAISTLIAEYESVIQNCRNRNKDAVAQFHTTDRKGRNFVEKEGGDLGKFSGKFPFQDAYTSKAVYSPDDFDAIIVKSEDRLEFLRAFAVHYG